MHDCKQSFAGISPHIRPACSITVHLQDMLKAHGHSMQIKIALHVMCPSDILTDQMCVRHMKIIWMSNSCD